MSARAIPALLATIALLALLLALTSTEPGCPELNDTGKVCRP